MLRTVAATLLAVILVAACSSASSPAPSPIGGSPGASSGANPSTGFDPSAITGTAILSGWQSSPGRGQCPDPDAARLPVGVSPTSRSTTSRSAATTQPAMAAKFASGDVPDVFYVDADYAQQWIDQGFLAPLDDYIAKSGFDTSQFFAGYASIFKGTDGKTYGLPKDGNTIAHGLQHGPGPDAAQDHGRARHRWPSRSRARTASRRRCA